MKIFNCPSCNATIYFENCTCLSCRSHIGFDPKTLEFIILTEPNKTGTCTREIVPRYCTNYRDLDCNWITDNASDEHCASCALTRDVPVKSDIDYQAHWKKLEYAKRRLLYQLLKFGLPMTQKKSNGDYGLAFDFLSKTNSAGAVTGHANGTITILLNEADSVEREQIRKQMSEPYRTLIGHFRHEIAHYYWNIIFANDDRKSAFRELFGDEARDYGDALQQYYDTVPEENWMPSYISAYASSLLRIGQRHGRIIFILWILWKLHIMRELD